MHVRAVSNRDVNPGALYHSHSGEDSEDENKTIQAESNNGGSITRPQQDEWRLIQRQEKVDGKSHAQ